MLDFQLKFQSRLSEGENVAAALLYRLQQL